VRPLNLMSVDEGSYSGGPRENRRSALVEFSELTPDLSSAPKSVAGICFPSIQVYLAAVSSPDLTRLLYRPMTPLLTEK
jgi:hypothetical protein